MPEGADWQLKARMGLHLRHQVKALANRRRLAVSRLVEGQLQRELGEADSATSSFPNESAIREMATLVAVEQILKLQEATIPGTTLSRRLLADAATAAIARVESIAASLEEDETE
jgi:hypothetical protein